MSRPKKSWPSLPRIWHAKDDFLSKGNLHHNKSDAFIVTLCRKMHSVAFRCLRYLNIGGEAFLAKGHHKRVWGTRRRSLGLFKCAEWLFCTQDCEEGHQSRDNTEKPQETCLIQDSRIQFPFLPFCMEMLSFSAFQLLVLKCGQCMTTNFSISFLWFPHRSVLALRPHLKWSHWHHHQQSNRMKCKVLDESKTNTDRHKMCTSMDCNFFCLHSI